MPEVSSLSARNQLVEQYLDLPKKVVHSLTHITSVKRIGFDEAYAVGLLYLIRAAGSFDPNRDQTFATWAFRSIRSGILRYSRQAGFCVSFPDKYWFQKARADAGDPLLLQATQVVSAYDAEEFIMDRHPAPDVLLEKQENADLLHEYLALLPAREQEVLQRYFFADEPTRSIAESMGVSRQRVAQWRASGLRQLARLMPTPYR